MDTSPPMWWKISMVAISIATAVACAAWSPAS